MKLQRHPLSALFSFCDLKDEDLDDMAEDIKTNGQLVPITLHEGMVLDGWNRYSACQIAKVKPVTMDLAPGMDPWEFVKGSNMLRRHMSPAERVAVMLKKQQMEGVPNGTQSDEPVSKLKVVDVAKDIEVSLGTAHKAVQIAKANDPVLTEALVEKRVSLDEAAKLAKMPEEERHAAMEAPKAKPEPKAEPVSDPDELARLKAENEELKERLAEIAEVLSDTQAELEAARRALDAEDLLGQFDKEIKRAQAQASVVQSRNNGLMNENSDLKGRLKSALRKIEKLEKSARLGEAA